MFSVVFYSSGKSLKKETDNVIIVISIEWLRTPHDLKVFVSVLTFFLKEIPTIIEMPKLSLNYLNFCFNYS